MTESPRTIAKRLLNELKGVCMLIGANEEREANVARAEELQRMILELVEKEERK